MKLEGFDGLLRHLKEMKRRVRSLNGKHKIPVKDLFNPQFMCRYTNFGSFDAMLDASGFGVKSPEDFGAIPDAAWDAFVARTTQFSNWEEMKGHAGQEYLTKKLGF